VVQPPASTPPVTLFVALADGPLGPAAAGVFTGGPDPTRLGRVDVPGPNQPLAYSLVVLSIQTLTGVGGTSEPDMPAPEQTASTSGTAAVWEVWKQLPGLISPEDFAPPLRGAAEVVEGMARVFAALPMGWQAPSPAEAATPVSSVQTEPAAAVAAGSGSEEVQAACAAVAPVNSSLGWASRRSLTLTVALCTLVLGWVRGRRLARRWGWRAETPGIPVKGMP
jgi:hypothetical protein